MRPGEKVLLNVVLAGENGAETARQVEYQVPIGAEPGPLYFTVADANTANPNCYASASSADAAVPVVLSVL